MVNYSWRPKVVCYAECRDESMVYFAPHDQVVIKGHVALQQAVLHLCTGYKSAVAIAASLSDIYDNPQVLQLLGVLRQQGVVIDSKNCWEAYHPYTCNPMPFVSDLTNEEVLDLIYEGAKDRADKNKERTSWSKQLKRSFAELLLKRHSHRQFTGNGIKKEILTYLIWCSYGQTTPLLENVHRRTVPSAGGLYPLRIHVAVRTSCGSFGPGIYRMDQHKDVLTLVKKWKFSDHVKFARCFLDDSYVHDYAACVVVSAKIERETKKYSNRGYRYAILEAGHSAQNLLLACAEQGLGCVEVGGFSDEELKGVLSMDQNTFPLTTVFVGEISSKGGGRK